MRALSFEPLEDRRLLSVVPPLQASWQAHTTFERPNTIQPSGYSSPPASALTPNQVRGAYGLGTYNNSGKLSNGVTFHGVQGDGSGQTIAIVDAYDDPAALSDLNYFSSYYNLPQFNTAGGPTFQQLDEYGGTNLPSAAPSGTWAIEESLDIQWAHAMAPMANIILFEAYSEGNDLYTAVQSAAGTSGVVVVSMSWSDSESSGDRGSDSTFTTPSGHLGGSATMGGALLKGGVTFLASAGDSGAYASGSKIITPQYPASSPNVVAVGGTSLYPSGNSFGTETGWGNGTTSWDPTGNGAGGGGISAYETQPSYQNGVVNKYSTSKRTYPDVSADANPYTGVPIYDTYDFGSTPWEQYGGTSLASPLWAGVLTVADQGRAISGLGSLDGRSQTLPMLYELAATDFHDILYDSSTRSTLGNTLPGPSIGPTTGSPSYYPGQGYDLATGLGSPNAARLVPQLAGPAQLVFGQPPTTATAGATLSPAITVVVEDSLGNVVVGDKSSVTVSIGSNPGGGTLSGTLTVTAINGVATLTDLSINPSGSYTLIASDTVGSSVLTVTSAPFTIGSPPTLATPAAASPNPVSDTSTGLSVLGADSGGESSLIYTWTATTLPVGAAPPVFSANGTNAAKECMATFSQAGDYVLTATITDAGGAAATSSVSVTVDQTATSISVTPAAIVLGSATEQQFTATALDQFGAALATQPAFTWSATTGSIASDGLFTAASSAATVTATSGPLSGAAQVTINQPPTVGTPAVASPVTVTGATTVLTVLGADDGGESNLTYTWSATTLPSGAAQPAYSANDSNAAKTTTVTFNMPGTYVFEATITDAGGLTATSSVAVVVDSSMTTIDLLPGASTLPAGAQQQFTATAVDQFGNTISPMPALSWTTTGGSISTNGLYNAPATGGPVTVTVSSGAVNATAAITLVVPSTWWTFDEGSGTTASDSSGNGNTATISGASWTTGIYGSALSFNGTNSEVTASGASLSGPGDFTVGAWIKTTATTAGVIIQQRGVSFGQYQLSMTSGGALSFWMRSTPFRNQFNIKTTAVVNDGLWHYVVGVRQGSTGYIYVDSVLAASGSSYATVLSLSSSNAVGVGADTYLNDLFFNGTIDDVRIFAAAISANGIASLATAPPTISSAAAASPSPVTGTTTALSVLGADYAGESTLTYTWTTAGTPPAAVVFSANGSNAAKNTTATFTAAGTYSFLVTIADAGGLSTTSSASVTVDQTLTAIAVQSPDGLAADGTEQFMAAGADQFGNPLANQPQFDWSLVGDGQISSTGVFTPPYAAGTATIQAASGSVIGNAIVAFPGAAKWNANTNASWDTVSSWTSSVLGSAVASPGLRGVIGDGVVLDAADGGTVNLDGVSPSLADVTFDSTGGYTIAQGSGGTLQLDNGANAATLTATAGLDTISAPVALNSNVIVLPAAGSQLTISGGISGAGQSLAVNGQGTVVLSGASSYTGGTTVSAGTLTLTTSSAIADGTSLTIGAGAAQFFALPLGVAPSAVVVTTHPAIASSADTAVQSAVMASATIAPSAAPSAASRAASSLVEPPVVLPSLVSPPALQTNNPSKSIAAFASGVPATHPIALSSVARRITADLAWLGQSADGSDSSDTHHKKDVAIQALDAVFAQYGR